MMKGNVLIGIFEIRNKIYLINCFLFEVKLDVFVLVYF